MINRRGRPVKYPFHLLKEPGDSFDVPVSSVQLSSLRAYAGAKGVDDDRTYQVRRFPDEGVYEVSLVALDRRPAYESGRLTIKPRRP